MTEYTLPNDERENERLEIQHNMFILSFDGRLGTSPPTDPGSTVGRVLDVGTGTGAWAIDFADEHPEAEILGVDLSAIQPSFAPPNVKFEIDDIEESWTYSQPFDFIHSRMMTTSISNWKEYIKKCYDNLVPGGYLELNELDLQPRSDDGTLKEDASLLLFSRLLGEASEKFGRPFFKDQSVLKDIMAEVGFEDLHAERFKWPSSPWAKDPKYRELGQWNLDNFVANLDGLLMASLTRGHEWSREEVTILAMNVRKEMTDPKIHSYSTIWSMWGRKPLATASDA
ncbi:methyltransferase domain-containing protein [Colletotrichum plurivorum]|uniref:Methyltransferase domain-containing protein n=1 Tax=Colletotrichum plurivorum TaxID=2175906 RepID=A0A8H6N8V2_9PEZI|nr:methyltransferase domain-containing protein [Colletotrichum plurivorum]